MGRRGGQKRSIEEAFEGFAALQGVDLAVLKQHERDQKFEHFVALHILRSRAPDIGVRDFDYVSTGDVDDNQLDAVAFLCGGRLLRGKAAAMALLEESEPLDLEIVAIQVTRSVKFDRSKISGFARGLQSLLSETAYFKENKQIQDARALKDFIVSECREREIPLRVRVRGYYAANAPLPRNAPNENVDGEFNFARTSLLYLPLVDEAEVEPVDRKRLSSIVAMDRRAQDYAPALEDYSGLAPLDYLARLPSTEGGSDCWLGAISLRAFLKLLSRDDDLGLREGVFEHNVRGFLSETDVNARIRDTLIGRDRLRFALFNNGVTIVAETITPASPGATGHGGAALRLANFQVVNGLQTTHVLHAARDQLDDDMDRLFVPVKLIATDDEALRRQIVDATNRQNPIQGLALYANDTKALDIEVAAGAAAARAADSPMAAAWPLIFERRAGLIGPLPQKRQEMQRLDLGDVLRSFVAVFLEQPHVAESGLAATLDLVGAKVLLKEHAPDAYVVSSLILAQVRRLIQAADPTPLGQGGQIGAPEGRAPIDGAARRTDSGFGAAPPVSAEMDGEEAARRAVGMAAELLPFEHHLSFALRLMIEPRPAPNPSGYEAKEYCAALQDRLLHEEVLGKAFERSVDAVRAARWRLSWMKRPMESAKLTRQVRFEADRRRKGVA